MKKRLRPAVSAAVISVLATGLTAAIPSAGSATPAGSPLRVSLVAGTDPVDRFLGTVEVTITNTSAHRLRLPRWQLPSASVETDLFKVSSEGVQSAYIGRLVKRGLPTAADFEVLRPGEVRRYQVDLSAAYDLSRPGEYTVVLSAPLQFASLSRGGLLRTGTGQPAQLRSAPLQMVVDGISGAGKDVRQALGDPSGTGDVARKDVRGDLGNPRGSGTVTGVKDVRAHLSVPVLTYRGCTAARQDQLATAVKEARAYAENAKGYLNAGQVGPRYTSWFGAYTAGRYATAKQNFVAIDQAMDQNNGQVTIDCGCTNNYYAYVYANRPYEIWVCNAFWAAPMLGTDSKAGTLIHEMSHFDVVAGTSDHVYGQSGARNLALNSPQLAVDNADNHEYFAENTPAEN